MGHYALLLFVRPSVAYLANNSRTRRSSVPKYGKKVPHLWCDSHTSFKIKRSKVKVTRPINADAHRAPYLLNGKAYELQTWYTDGGRRRRRAASATGAMTFKVKGQGRKVTWSVWAVLAQCCTCVIRGRRGIPCLPNPAATLLVMRWYDVNCSLPNFTKSPSNQQPKVP